MKRETALKIVAEIVIKYLHVNHGFDSSLYEQLGFERGKNSNKIVLRAHEALRVLGYNEKSKQLGLFEENKNE